MPDNNSNEKAEWGYGNFQGPNQRLIKVAEHMTELYRIVVRDKLANLKGYVSAEAARHNSPELNKIAKTLNDIKIEGL